MDFHGMNRKVLQSLCKTYGIPANTKNSEMATRLSSFFKADGIKDNFKLMERKDLQTLCKKHGIPANLKNNEMATRLASLFQETLICTDLNEHSNPESVLFAETTPPPSSVQLVVSSSESVLFVETTPPPPLVQLAVRNSESDLRVLTGHTIVKDVVPAVIAEEDIITSKEVPRSVHSFGAKLAEAEAVLENSAECWNESLSRKDDERGPLDSEMQSANPHGNFSDCNTVKSFVEEQADICEVGCISAGYCVNQETHDEVKDDSLTKSELIVSTERECKLNVLELSGSLSTDFASISSKEENVSECLEEDEMKALHKAASNALDGSSVFTAPERNIMLMEQLSENGKIRANDTMTQHNDEAVESHAVVFTTLEQVLLLGDSELYEVGKEEEHADTDSEQKKAVKTAEFDDQCTAKRHPFPEESELEEASKSKECKVVDLQVDFDKFTGADITAKSHDMSDVLTDPESHSLMGDFELDGAENEYRETKDVERHLPSGDSGLDETRKIKYNTAATCEESPEKQQRLGNSEPHTAGNQERKEVEFKNESAFFTRLESRLLLGESGQDSLGNGKSGSTHYQSHHASSPRDNTTADSSDSITHKVSNSHELDAEVEAVVEELATIDEPIEAKVTKNSQRDYNGNILLDSSGGSPVSGNICVLGGTEDEHLGCNSEEAFGKTCEKSGCKIIKDEATGQIATPFGLGAAEGTLKQSKLHSPHVNSANLSDFDTEGTKITMGAERNVTLSSYGLTSPAEGDSKTIGEIFSILDVGGTCSMVSEESVPSTDIQNQTNNALEELAITDNNETDELTEAKVTKNLDSSRGSSVLGQTCVLGGTEAEHLDYNSEFDLKDEATDLIATAFAATLSPEEALNESAENKECANIGESGTLSEKQVRREPNLIYRTQVKHKRHDMKENTPHSKIVENLNVTARRTSKRQPLQDLRNISEEPKKPKTSQPKHNSPQKTCNKEVSVLFTAHNIQTGNRFAVLSDIDDC